MIPGDKVHVKKIPFEELFCTSFFTNRCNFNQDFLNFIAKKNNQCIHLVAIFSCNPRSFGVSVLTHFQNSGEIISSSFPLIISIYRKKTFLEPRNPRNPGRNSVRGKGIWRWRLRNIFLFNVK